MHIQMAETSAAKPLQVHSESERKRKQGAAERTRDIDGKKVQILDSKRVQPRRRRLSQEAT